MPNKTPTGELSPETYVGYDELQYLDPPEVARDTPAVYQFPASLPLGALGLSGTWTDHAQEATAGTGAELELGFLAQDVYLVLGGTGTLDVSVNGQHTQTIESAGFPGSTPSTRRLGHERKTPAARLAGRPGLRLHLRLNLAAATSHELHPACIPSSHALVQLP